VDCGISCVVSISSTRNQRLYRAKPIKWLEEEFLRLIESKLADIFLCGGREKRPFIMLHGTHPQHNTHCAHGWIKRGQNKEIKTNSVIQLGGRQRVNINGVVNAHDPTDVVIEESSSINAQSTIALLKKLEQKTNLCNVYLWWVSLWWLIMLGTIEIVR
jgi:hypothetical protein